MHNFTGMLPCSDVFIIELVLQFSRRSALEARSSRNGTSTFEEFENVPSQTSEQWATNISTQFYNGQFELTLGFDEALKACDNAFLFKTMVC